MIHSYVSDVLKFYRKCMLLCLVIKVEMDVEEDTVLSCSYSLFGNLTLFGVWVEIEEETESV